MWKLINAAVSVVALATLLMLSSATAVGSLGPLENQGHGCFQTVQAQPCVARTCFAECRRLYGPDCKPLCTAHIENQCCCNQFT